jgi:signal transduction histidine kinase
MLVDTWRWGTIGLLSRALSTPVYFHAPCHDAVVALCSTRAQHSTAPVQPNVLHAASIRPLCPPRKWDATAGARGHLILAAGLFIGTLVRLPRKDETFLMRWLTIPLHRDADVVPACSRLRAWAEALGLAPIARARLVTIGAEAARVAAASRDGSIEFGWEGARPFCVIESPGRLAPDLTHEPEFDVAVVHSGERTRLRLEVAAHPSRDELQRALAEAPEATAVDILEAQNLEMARMLGTLRDHEAELALALEEARLTADEATARALRLEELCKRKDELLAVASHDLRSPVAAARGALDLLEPTLPALAEDQKHLLAVARRGCDSVVHLIGNLLSAALMELDDDDPDDPTAVDFVQTTRDVTELMAVIGRQKGVVVEVHAPPSVSPVRGDPVWARQVLTNLVNNAIKYAPKQGGQVTITISEQPGTVSLVFEDNGVGIPPEKMDRVFDKLAKLRPRGTAGERGTGIGLYVTKKLVERMGGTIVAKPRAPAGMRFEVRLPTTTPRADRAAPSVSPPA